MTKLLNGKRCNQSKQNQVYGIRKSQLLNLLALLCVIVLTSCASLSGDSRIATHRRDPSASFIELPKMHIERVNYEDGIDSNEAVAVSSEYFRYYLGSCGMPDQPDSGIDYFTVQLWRGIAGTYAGRFWIAKDGSKILFEPARESIARVVQKRLTLSPDRP